MRVRPRSSAILNKANLPEPGEHYGVPTRPYVYGATAPTKPTTYVLDDTTHRFDGTCHETCEDVR